MVTFGSELLAAAVAGSEPGEHPLRHVAELPARERPPTAVAGMGRAGRGARVHRSRHQLAMGASG